jgi:hypothetical protein
MIKTRILFCLLCFFIAVYAQSNLGKPQIAVYVTGDLKEGEKKAINTVMLDALVKSKRYTAIERSEVFLAKIAEEQKKQRDGSVDDSQISKLGKQFGVQFVCVADVTKISGSYLVSARIIDVETAAVDKMGKRQGAGNLRNAERRIAACDKRGKINP